jgi:hypothetical protein
VRKHPKDLLLFWEDTSLTLGRTKRGRNEVGDAVPSEARDASLTLGRTKWGVGASLRSAGQKRGCLAGQMEWEGIVTPNIAKGLTCGFLHFAQMRKGMVEKWGDRPPFKIRQKKVYILSKR